MRPIFVLLLDLAMVAGAACGAVLLRDNPEVWAQRFWDLQPYLLFTMLASILILPIAGTSRNLWHYSTFNDFVRIVLAAIAIVLVASGATFAYDRFNGLARTIPILHALLIVIILCAVRAGVRLRHAQRARPQITPILRAVRQAETVLVIGDNAVAELFLRATHDFARDTIQVAGILAANDRHRGRRLHGAAILGQPEDVSSILQQLSVHGVDVRRIVVTEAPVRLSRAVRDALREVEDGTDIVVDYFAERLSFDGRTRQATRPLNADADADRLPSLRELAVSANLSRPYWRVKRLFDFVMALALLVVSAPVLVVVAVVVAIDVGAPVLFWQERPGRLGRRLRLYKFRTMRSAHDADGTRIDDARRLSRIGKFLRRSRIDELPQLFHILRGEMSFIGPRPLLSNEQTSAHAARLAVRPGLTGWAQVNGGRDVAVTDKVAMDLWYIRNAGFRLDLRIVLKTLRTILRGEMPDEHVIAAAWTDAAAWKAQLRAGRRTKRLVNAHAA